VSDEVGRGPERLVLRDVAATEPQEGEVLVRVSSAGMNFADTQARQNLYLRRFELPFIPGSRWPASWSATARASKPASAWRRCE